MCTDKNVCQLARCPDIELASGYQKDPSTAGADNGIANYWCNWYLENTKWEGILKWQN